jgi:hypothetical protein
MEYFRGIFEFLDEELGLKVDNLFELFDINDLCLDFIINFIVIWL